jgi:hypothetical protein
MEASDLSTSKKLAEALGIGPAVFYEIVRELKLTPAATKYSLFYKAQYPLWNQTTFDLLIQHPLVCGARERSQKYRKARASREEARDRIYERMYPDWRAALPATCLALLNLNRYAKWESCSRQQRDEIYELKTELLRMLYQNNYATGVVKHAFQRPGLICWGCNGEGCDRCDSTGFYRDPDTLHFVLFRFEINGHPFSWHQPEYLVTWPVTFTAEEEQSYVPDTGEKPLSMDVTSFADAKALIKFVLERSHA